VTTGLRLAERALPAHPEIVRYLAERRPDVVLFTPYLGLDSNQPDFLRAAQSLGLRTAICVKSWDNLSSKATIRPVPDRLFVWNEIQRRDAAEFHRVPPERILVTGAQLFDGWFERRPSVTREAFLARVGLDSPHYVLYVGSSPNIAPPELEIPFVRRWIEALRGSGDPRLEQMGVLVRPHPYNVEAWAGVELADLGGAIAPREPPELPMTERDEALYFDSIQFSEAVVGINTTAMVESFIARRPVLTIRSSEFCETQEGTLHFGELVSASGGALQAAATLDEHLGQLRSTIQQPESFRGAIDRFLLTFVRPRGLDLPATPILAQGIEELAALGSRSARAQRHRLPEPAANA
jgi:hypothetical protein